jgi:hypothetical protein
MQKMMPNPDGTMPYAGPMDCAMQTLRKEVRARGEGPCGAEGRCAALLCWRPAPNCHSAPPQPSPLPLVAGPSTPPPPPHPRPPAHPQGPLKFYTGFSTYVIRIAPHVVFTLMFLDALPKWQAKVGL